MTISSSFLCSLLIIIALISQANAFYYVCDSNNDRGNYSTMGLYDRHLKTVLKIITTQASNNNNQNGFFATSIGETTNKANAIAQCKGDVTPTECGKCLEETKANLVQVCQNRKEAIGWYEGEQCMLRYSDRSILGLNELWPAFCIWNVNDASQADKFNQVVKNLLDSLRGTVQSSGQVQSSASGLKFATSTATGPDGQLVYGLEQCTPDLSAAQCDDCLVQSIAEIPNYCNNKIGCRIIRPSCYFRYETYPFSPARAP